VIKVAHITTVDSSLRYLLLDQLIELRAAGYEVIGVSSPGADVPIIEAAGIRHISAPMTRNFTPLADAVSLWKLYRVMRRERFTLVHTHNAKPGLLGQLAARMAGVPIVVNTVHGFYFHEHMPKARRWFYLILEKIGARCSDVILSQNREDIETALKLGVCSPARIHHLGNGIDLRRFDPRKLDRRKLVQLRAEIGLPPAGPVVGFVGRLVADKGLPELLQAAAIIRKQLPQARFLIIGPADDEKRDALTPEVAQRYGVSDVCLFPGPRQDLPELLGLMDVFVLPSHREGFPRSPMEASAMGVPCVVSDVRGCREVVDHGRNGLIVPLGDVKGLSDALLRLLSDPAEAKRLGAEGRFIAAQRFDQRTVFGTVQREYRRLLRSKGLTAPLRKDDETTDNSYVLS
jgi:glycosyltransferase involved in cell wall biosynthesis